MIKENGNGNKLDPRELDARSQAYDSIRDASLDSNPDRIDGDIEVETGISQLESQRLRLEQANTYSTPIDNSRESRSGIGFKAKAYIVGALAAGAIAGAVLGYSFSKPAVLVKENRGGRTEYVINGKYEFIDNGEALGQPIAERGLAKHLHRYMSEDQSQ